MFYFVARSDGLCIDNILRNACLGMRKNAKRTNVFIEAERLNPNMAILRIFNVIRKVFEGVFGENWSVNFLTLQCQRLEIRMSRS